MKVYDAIYVLKSLKKFNKVLRISLIINDCLAYQF